MKFGSFSVLMIMMLFFLGCGGSPKNAYALKTKDYGQCRSIQKGEKIFYKKKRVRYVCEDKHVLLDHPYEKKNEWYYKAGLYDGKKVKKASSTKVVKILRKQCDLQGSYGRGTQKIKKFYFNTKIKACKPFIWSGDAGMVPFDSQDECRVECFHLR